MPIKPLLVCLIYLFSSLVNAQHQHPETPLVGVHGMAAFDVDGTFYASHMPLANSIHAHQVVFSFSLDEKAERAYRQLHTQFSLITIVPEKFDLAMLMNGKLTRFKANVHANHFERGGEVRLEDIDVEVERLLLVEPLKNAEGGNYYVIALDDSKSMLVHQISAKPSYDQILIAEPKDTFSNSKLLKLTNGQPWSATEKNSHSIKSIYLETQDFQ